MANRCTSFSLEGNESANLAVSGMVKEFLKQTFRTVSREVGPTESRFAMSLVPHDYICRSAAEHLSELLCPCWYIITARRISVASPHGQLSVSPALPLVGSPYERVLMASLPYVLTVCFTMRSLFFGVSIFHELRPMSAFSHIQVAPKISLPKIFCPVVGNGYN